MKYTSITAFALYGMVGLLYVLMDNIGEVRRLQARRSSRLRLFTILVIFFVSSGILLGGGFYLHRSREAGPLPKAIIKSAGFPLYYPVSLPTGYILRKESVRDEGGIVFYALQKDDKTINISEQVAPSVLPDFKKLEESLGFKKIDLLNGSAVFGLNIDRPTAIMITNTTMITINCPKTVPNDVLIDITKSMHSITD